MTYARLATALLIAMSLSALAVAELGSFQCRILFNPSLSAPRGFYVVIPVDQIERDQKVAALLPEWAAELAAERGYLPRGIPVIKVVWAVAGDRVCSQEGRLMALNRPDLVAFSHDREGRSMPLWSGCRRLNPDEIFLASDAVPDSFDSRYFGPVRTQRVLGRAALVWPRHARTEP